MRHRRILRRIGNDNLGRWIVLLVGLGLSSAAVLQWRKGYVSAWGPVGIVMVLVCIYKWRDRR